MHWYAVHTRSRHERKAAEEIRQLCEVFLPEYWCRSRRRDRFKRIRRPLFPGYLFVRSALTPSARLGILQVRGVVRIVGNRSQPVPVPEVEVASLQRLLHAAQDAGPHPLIQGQRVEVMAGTLRGVIGRVASSPRGKRIVVTVELLGRAVSARLDTDALAPYEDDPAKRIVSTRRS
ncbi:MAG: transcriptional antiterminator [Deltaproteobacteria bacterium]|nr:transcriptional antiterminator [Deltaproteobacteria bacterium]